jgi:hypothetical protein
MGRGADGRMDGCAAVIESNVPLTPGRRRLTE